MTSGCRACRKGVAVEVGIPNNDSGRARSEIRACKGILPNKATFVVARSFDPKLCFVAKIGINFVITGGLFESTN